MSGSIKSFIADKGLNAAFGMIMKNIPEDQQVKIQNIINTIADNENTIIFFIENAEDIMKGLIFFKNYCEQLK